MNHRSERENTGQKQEGPVTSVSGIGGTAVEKSCTPLCQAELQLAG